MNAKTKIILAVSLVLLVGLTPALFAQYDKDAVVKVMRGNLAAVQALNTAVNAKDFYTAAVKLMELAGDSKALLEVNPPKGDKAEWDRIHNALILAAFRGIGACGTQNLDALKTEVGTVMALMKEGHTKFR